MDQIIEKVHLDPNLESYRQFFDHEWCRRIFNAVKTSSLKDAVDELMIVWRSANGAHLLPWLMVDSLKRSAEGEGNGSLQFRSSYVNEVVNWIVDKLEARLQYSLNFDQRRDLRRAVADLEKEAHKALKIAQSKVKFDVDGYWAFLIRHSEFQFSILGTQRINYTSLFFAYEDFLANVIRTRASTYSSKNDPIKAAFAREFGEPLTDFCWNDDEVKLAQLVRNALAHNGGRLGKELKDGYADRFVDVTGVPRAPLQGEQFNVDRGKIQITPRNTAHLFRVLKERVSKIVETLA